ncbi:YheT family hydrolase [Sinobacterium norvegicum]|nr:alpha/beta fold hydrolase [Sinobacterium norvegicum]
MKTFKPPVLLRNPHIQSILSSAQPRKAVVRHRARGWIKHSQRHLFDCNGITMEAFSNIVSGAERLCILIHGWEGSAESNYMLASCTAMLQAGISVVRLNLRDHGNTHHLNRELFNSTRLEEVLLAQQAIQQAFNHQQYFLCGFSLGGNFALRSAADSSTGISHQKVIAVCPVISPYLTMQTLNTGPVIYHNYFAKKWKRSLQKKLIHHPALGYQETLKDLYTLDDMNAYFVPNHTDYDDCDSYLNGYSVEGSRLQTLHCDTHIISSADDPVILSAHLDRLKQSDRLTVELSQYGGHCGFLANYKLNSWLDTRLPELISLR